MRTPVINNFASTASEVINVISKINPILLNSWSLNEKNIAKIAINNNNKGIFLL